MDEMVKKYITEHRRKEFVQKGYWMNKTLGDYFDATVKKYPAKEAIICGEDRITFSEFADKANALAGGLLDLGIGKKDMVSVQLPNWPEFCYLQVALGKIGAMISPLHMVYRERELLSMLTFCETRVLIVCSEYKEYEYAKTIKEIWPKLPNLKHVIVLGNDVPEGMISFDDLFSVKAVDARGKLKGISVDPNDLFYLNFTSGTEGSPKGFLHTHNTILSCMYHVCCLEGESDEELADKAILAHSPMTHTYGHMMPYEAIINGTKVVMVDSYDPKEALKLVERERISAMSGTPAHIVGFLNQEDFDKYDLSSLKSVGVGGAPCPVKLIKEVQDKLGAYVTNTYGMGETIGHTMTRRSDSPELIFETVGKPLPGTEVGIFDDVREKMLPVGERGEIAYRGAYLFIAYFKEPERTEETRNADGWFFTGDLGQLDEKGYLRLTGRKKDMINRGGSKVFPDEIENILLHHPKIFKVAVVGMFDYRLGEKVCAYVIPKEGETITLEDVESFMESQKVMKYNIPERIEMVDEFPMLPTGKIKKEALRQDIAEKIKKEQRGQK